MIIWFKNGELGGWWLNSMEDRGDLKKKQKQKLTSVWVSCSTSSWKCTAWGSELTTKFNIVRTNRKGENAEGL